MRPSRSDRERETLLARSLAETSYHRFPGGRKKIGFLLDALSDDSPRRTRVLDVGCGNGGLAFPLAALGAEVVGVDTEAASIEHCRSRNRFANATFVLTTGDLREIEGVFDLIVCSEVLEHLDEPQPLVAAMRARLAPAGRIFITVPNGYGLREIGGRCESFLRHRVGLEQAIDSLRGALARVGMPSAREKYLMHTCNPDQGHVQKFTRSRIVALLRSGGLEILGWTNSFVILSVLHCRSGLSRIERLDEWAADHLPAAFASGWYIVCGAAAERSS